MHLEEIRNRYELPEKLHSTYRQPSSKSRQNSSLSTIQLDFELEIFFPSSFLSSKSSPARNQRRGGGLILSCEDQLVFERENLSSLVNFFLTRCSLKPARKRAEFRGLCNFFSSISSYSSKSSYSSISSYSPVQLQLNYKLASPILSYSY